MEVLLKPFILYVLISFCVGTSPPKKPPPCNTPPTCGPNEHYLQNTNACEKTCGNRDYYDQMGACFPSSKCFCVGGYMRLYDNGTGPCITEDQCPPVEEPCPDGDRNATREDCPSYCQPICQQRVPGEFCPAVCLPRGCVCKPGFILDASIDQCVAPEDCPIEEPCPDGDRNATREDCPSYCPPTCQQPVPGEFCPAACLPRGCVCKPGFILDASINQCVAPYDCPAPEEPPCPDGDRNATAQECPSWCQPTCAQPVPGDICPDACLPRGCICKPGYILDDNTNQCIAPEDCPVVPPEEVPCPDGDVNATAQECPSWCQPTCDRPVPGEFCPAACLPRGCVCKPGFILESRNGVCISKYDCPAPDIECGINEVPTPDVNICPPRTCESLDRAYICLPNDQPPVPGCVCEEGYYSDDDNNCVPPKLCPPRCNGDINAVYSTCTGCEPYCGQPEDRVCPAVCGPPGCQCKKGYVRSGNKCVLPKQCPGCNGDRNATYTTCTGCEPYCGQPDGIACPAVCGAPGCQCNQGYVRSGYKCILPQDCPGCNGDINAEYTTCTSRCPAYCGQPAGIICPTVCGPPGCQCKQGYVLLGDKCVREEDCPVPQGCNGDKNATYQECPSMCQPTCENPKLPEACVAMCAPDGCVCNPGYVLSSTGQCILPQDCPVPPPGCNGDRNATFQECPSMCQPTCKKPILNEACILMCAPDGCVCNPGYVLSDDGVCILPEDCPVPGCNGDLNATYKECPSMCQPSCDKPNQYVTCVDACAPDGCVCNRGYLLLGGKCVLPKDCPGGQPICPANEGFVNCKVECPDSYCPTDDSRAIIACDPPYPCPFGCACNAGFKRLRYPDDQCIEYFNCPPVNCTRPNEVWDPKPPNCIADRCEDAINPQPCDKPYYTYTPQCVCKKGYYRNASDICVPQSECPVQCSIPEQCRPTCAVPNPPNCPVQSPASSNIDGCECQAGYILSEAGGKCILISECPQDQSCNGDPHARVKSCPWSCPSTCDSPNASRCDKKCQPVGCECESGYLLSSDGKCILPEDCPRGDPCGPNGTFVDCGFRCPNQYCPEDDSRVQIACKPGRPCPPGCACKLNYKRLSYDNDICIEATDCPPVECTRPNEVWDSCPSDCLAEDCSNVNDTVAPCYTLLLNCQPKCVCKKGYYRNSSDICIPAKECYTPNPCLSDCSPTCANPNPSNCPFNPDEKRCCESGYIQLQKGGECVRIEDCPTNIGCNGDPNAVVKQCPAPCPGTCDHPETFPCLKACLEVGCECAPGYILSNVTLTCIDPKQCPGGDPCGKNARFGCRSGCPTDYCPTDDSRGILICETYPFSPCVPGCVCQYGYIKNNRQENKCIEPSTCPPVNCTRQNEIWNCCPSPCLAEGCEDVDNQPTACNTLVKPVCQPRCVCTKGNFRNSTDICIPAKDCKFDRS